MGILLNKSKNYIINGAMDFWQRNTTFTAIANLAYSADRFQYAKVGTMVHTVSRDTVDVPTLAQSGFRFPSSLSMALTTPQASLAAGDYMIIEHKIEGQVFAPLAGKTMTLSFWVEATLPGQYSVSFGNLAGNRSLVRSFTVNTANTWEKKTITITHDTSGTWDYTSDIGMRIRFALASGATFTTSSENTWLSGNFFALTGQVNGVQAGATNFKIAGIQLEEGTSSSNFERAGGNIANELQLCQRYYEKSYPLAVAPGSVSANAGYAASFNTGTGLVVIPSVFKVSKRIAPLVVVYNPATGATGSMDRTGTVIAATPINTNENGSVIINSAVTAINNGHTAHWTADAEL